MYGRAIHAPAALGGDRLLVSTDSDTGPDQLHDTEGPCPREEPVDTRQQATEREREDKAAPSCFQGVHRHHEGDRTHAVDRDRHAASESGSRRELAPSGSSGALLGTLSLSGETAAELVAAQAAEKLFRCPF